MKICHSSDSHGMPAPLPCSADLIIHTGDILPNSWFGKQNQPGWLRPRANRRTEEEFQAKWVEQHINEWRTWLGGIPALFVLGNHDFISPVPILVQHGIEAYDITNKRFEFKGMSFYGFPFIPEIAGEWCFEKNIVDMQTELIHLDTEIRDGLDVLCCHCPPCGPMSEKWGNSVLTNYFNYQLSAQYLPKALLCGHDHGCFGISVLDTMLISNAATTCNVINL